MEEPSSADTNEIYRVRRRQRVIDLLLAPGFAVLGAAFPIYTAALFVPKLDEGVAFLRHGGALAYVASLSVLVPLLAFFGWFVAMCLRVVMRAWADALTTATCTRDGTVTHASSTSRQLATGKVLPTPINHLSVDGHLYTSLPESTVRRLKVGDRLRIVHTPRADYVVSVQRLPPAG